jgi:dienelactone hydrolase
MRVSIIGAILLALAGCTQSVPLSSSGGPGGFDVKASGELYKLDGPGPYPAIVVLHGCAGVTPQYHVWAQRLNRWGYVALVVDSLGPRGYQTVCDSLNVSTLERARDAFAAAAWLRSQPFVDPARIGVIGFSHGGSTVLKAVLEPVIRAATATPFRAAVAYYPGCARDFPTIASDTLILIGDADTQASVLSCRAFVASAKDASHPVELKVYPGANHLFDAIGLPRNTAYDPAAADDAFTVTRTFFDARLK